MYASVIIEYSVKKLDKEFIYMIPNDLKDKIKVGMKVLVPFGYQEVVGFVMELLENVDDTTYELKYITQIVDEKLVLNKELLDLGTFLSSSTLCTKISAFQTMLPSSLKVKKNTSNYDLYDEYIYIKDKEKVNNYIKEFENKMSKTVDALKEDYVTIRAGRANPHILDRLRVDYYGTPTPIQQVANVSVPEARMIQIQPWEASLIKDIEKAILVSDLGLTPNNDGKTIRLVFPELTEDRRKELAKDIKKKGDNAKVAIRNIRRDANDAIKKENKAGDISDDEAKNSEDEIQKITDKYIAMIDSAIDDKTKEILTV